MNPTPEQIIEAGRMRAAGMGWDKIACRLCIGVFKLRAAMQPGYLEYKRETNQIARDILRHGFTKRRRRLKPQKTGVDPGNKASHAIVPPRDVLFDRDVRLTLVPRSLTAALLGDPLPGRSALDKRMNS